MHQKKEEKSRNDSAFVSHIRFMSGKSFFRSTWASLSTQHNLIPQNLSKALVNIRIKAAYAYLLATTKD